MEERAAFEARLFGGCWKLYNNNVQIHMKYIINKVVPWWAALL